MDGLTVITSRVDGFEGFRDAVYGSHVDVMQLQRGRFRGLLTHIGVGDFSLSVGSFSVGLRTQRTSSDPKLIVGMLLGAESRVTHWSYDMDPGDVLVIPPGEAVARLREIVSQLSDPDARVSPEAADFWRRAIIDVVTATVMHQQPPGTTETIPSATRLIRNAEHYIETAGSRPVHISEICAECGVSRRSLHRAFTEVLGIGPVTFLQRKRLCGIHSALRHADPATTTIAEIALQHGFLNLGRFSGYYRALFDEYPSETFGKRYPGRGRQRPVEPAAISIAASPASRSISLPR
jgi:AraC-like DNA-binding protein